jgi:hypothetical protein
LGYLASSVLVIVLVLQIVASTTPSTASAIQIERQLQPAPNTHRILHEIESSWWHRQLKAAEEVVEQRRRQRHRNLRHININAQPHQSDTQPLEQTFTNTRDRKIQYLPSSQHAPDSLLNLNNNANSQSFGSTNTCLSPLQRWFVTNIESISATTWSKLQSYNATSLSYLHKHYVSSSSGNGEYFGTYGERTNEMKENHERLVEFWVSAETSRAEQSASAMMDKGTFAAATYQYNGVTETSPNRSGEPGNVVLLGMHGVDLAENAKLVPTLQQVYNLDTTAAYSLANEIQTLIQEIPGAFNNPLLTANAIATQSSNSDGSNRERDSVIVGDGVFTFLEWLELGSDGPDYIHSHEFSHHIQYDLGVEKMGWSVAQETRRMEMMADVFGSYYLAHAKGGRMDASRLYQVHRAAFSLGDCEDAEGTHHGTPRQRECASNFGANLALTSYVDGGYIIPPIELRRLFDEKYDFILNLDGDECEAIVQKDTLDKTIYGDEFNQQYTYVGNVVGGTDLHLEPPDWFDEKPSSYTSPYDGQQTTLQGTPQSSSTAPYYEGTPMYVDPEEGRHSQLDNSLNGTPPTVHDEERTVGDGDDWFEESQWYGGRTVTSHGSSLRVLNLLFTSSILIVLL